MSIQLSAEQEAALREKVEGGDYPSVEKALDVALRLLDTYDEVCGPQIQELRRLFQDGLGSGDAIELDMDAIIREAQEEFLSRRKMRQV